MMNESNHIHFIDNLKIALIMLVVAHHAGQAYGPGGWWYFQQGEAIGWLGRFFTVNAAFFMSLFFFLSAYFLPASIEKKGVGTFLKDRFSRIGIPLLLGFFIIIPFLMYLYYLNFRGYGSIPFFIYYANIFFGLGEKPKDWSGPSWPDMQFGHLWFLEHLLVYAVLFGGWIKFFQNKEQKDVVKNLKGYQITLFVLSVTLVTFMIRIWFPIDHWTAFLGIIQSEFAHVPQYVSFFSLGIMAYSRKWLLTLKTRTGYLWLALGIVMSSILYFGGDAVYPYLTKGGPNTGSLARSFIETVLCISLVIGLITLFREKASRTNRFLNHLSTNVFVVYFLHVPVVVLIQYTLANMAVPIAAKFLMTTFLGIFLSFLLSIYVWRKIPYLRNLM